MNHKDIKIGNLYIRIKDTRVRYYPQKSAVIKINNKPVRHLCPERQINFISALYYDKGYVFKAAYKDESNFCKGVYDEDYIFHNSDNIKPYEGDYVRHPTYHEHKLFYVPLFMERGCNSIKTAEISTMNQLLTYTETDILKLKYVGMNSLMKIKKYLETIDKKLHAPVS